MFSLKPHNSAQKPFPEVKGSLEVEGEELVVKISSRLTRQPWVNPELRSDYQNWGLWEHDVFELFLTRAEERTPYLELQVSPLNQKLALLIEAPRKTWKYPEEDPFLSESKVEGDVWKSSFRVALAKIPGESAEIFGNIHAIIGQKRIHLSLNPNLQERPDFHRPDLFVKLGEMA